MQRLNIREYWDAVGTDNIDKVIKRVGSSKQVFRQLRYGLKRPSPKRAQEIVDAARKITPGWEPNLELLLQGIEPANRERKIAPSDAFARKARRIAKAALAVPTHQPKQTKPVAVPKWSATGRLDGREEIRRLWRSGTPKKEICLLLGVHRATVDRAVQGGLNGEDQND